MSNFKSFWYSISIYKYLLLIILVIVYIICQFVNCNKTILNPCIELTYIGLFSIIVLFGLHQISLHTTRLINRRKVEDAEIQNLYSESEYFISISRNQELKELISQEVDRIKNLKAQVLELDLLPLRKLLVDIYPKEELTARAQEELRLIDEYTPDTSTYNDLYDEWKDRIAKAKQSDGEAKNNGNKFLKAELKAMREVVAWYDKTWAQGETIINGVAYWSATSILAMLAIGLLPLFHPNGSSYIGIMHWAAFGWCGALLSSIITIGKLDVNEVGEQAGKQLLLQILGKIIIGIMTSILLYVALAGEILDGKIFPNLPIERNSVNNRDYWLQTGMSIFWGIFAGFSLKILAGLIGLAEGSFRNDGSK